MKEGARGFCLRCLRAFLELADGQAPTDFHVQVRALVKKSPRCRACFESYKKTSALCRAAWVRARAPERREELRTTLRKRLRPADRRG